MKSYLPNDIKDQNRKIIYDILLNNPPIAKIEISEMTTMSLVTVGKIIDYFESIGILTHSNENREGARGLGRKRNLYDFNPNSFMSIGVQIIDGKVSAVLLNLKQEVIDSLTIKKLIYFWDDQLSLVLHKIKNHFQEKLIQYNAKLLGIGIAVDGGINTYKEIIRMKVSYAEEKEFNYHEIIKTLEKELQLPIFLENDVNASVFCEFNQLEVNDLLEIALNNGIGAGIILNKKLYRGNNSGVGELEFMCFDLDYVAMPTSVGWLETKLNIRYLEKRFNIDFNNIKNSKKENIYECVEYVSKYIALTICNAVSLLEISNIVLSGPVIKSMPEEIIGKIEEYIFRYTGWKFNVFFSTIEFSSAIGAGLLLIENELSQIIFG
ncbi:MAG: ROK family protein [Lachnospirales bacterium]